jgi:hypothetical protein
VQLPLAGLLVGIFDPCRRIFVRGVTKLSPKPSSFATRTPLRIEICRSRQCCDSVPALGKN